MKLGDDPMNLIVVGCGRLGSQLAYRLFLKGHKVTVVDKGQASFKNLPADFLGRAVEGEATHFDSLHRAGIEQANGLAAVTSSDAVNAVVGYVAKTTYGCPNVVVRNYDPILRPMLDAFQVQVISSALWGAQRIEELLYNTEIRSVFSAGNGEVEIYEWRIPKICAGRPLSDLMPDCDCIAVGITRSGTAFVPSPDTILQQDDILVISATFEGIELLRKNFQRLEEGAQ
jgi:trk system potassium uptake protein